MKVTRALIPAAGYGTRMLPATKAVPKEMLPIVDRPTIHYIVEEAVSAGIEDVVLITGRNKAEIEDYFDYAYELEDQLQKGGKSDLHRSMIEISSMANLISIRQKKMLGLGHAVLSGRPAIGNNPFAVMLGDDLVKGEIPCIKQLIDVYEREQKAVISIMEVPNEDVSKYGVISGEDLGDGVFRIDSLVEKPPVDEAPSNLAVIGRYVLPPEIFDILEKTKPGAGGEIQLTDALAVLAERGDVLGYRFSGKRYDTGNPFGFVEATLAYALDHPEVSDRLKSLLQEKQW